MEGKNFLKVCGILMIIGGGIAVIASGFVGLFTYAAASIASAVGVGTGLLIPAAICSILAGIAELVCGIIGVVNCSKPEKANTCFTFGCIVGGLSLICFILNTVSSGFSIVDLITSLVLPVLFIIGALKNKNSVA